MISHPPCFWTVLLWQSDTAGPVPVSAPFPSIQFVNSDPFAHARVAAVQSRVAAQVVSGPERHRRPQLFRFSMTVLTGAASALARDLGASQAS